MFVRIHDEPAKIFFHHSSGSVAVTTLNFGWPSLVMYLSASEVARMSIISLPVL